MSDGESRRRRRQTWLLVLGIVWLVLSAAPLHGPRVRVMAGALVSANCDWTPETGRARWVGNVGLWETTV